MVADWEAFANFLLLGERDTRHDDHENEKEICGWMGQKFDAGLVHEFAQLRLGRQHVDDDVEWESENEEENEKDENDLIHFGYFSNARVPDLDNLLLTIRVGYELYENK